MPDPMSTDETRHAGPKAASDCGAMATWLHCNYMAITTRIVRIGNSRGIRVPKVLLEQAALPDDVEIHAEAGRLVVTAAKAPRAGWAAAAKAMHAAADDTIVDAPVPTRFDRADWKW